MTLTEFLLARIAERETAAKLADHFRLLECPDRDAERHVAYWSPTRVLAECEAKRKIVEHHESYRWRNGGNDTEGENCRVCRPEDPADEWENQAHPCLTLRLLALPYADHEDYNEAWRL